MNDDILIHHLDVRYQGRPALSDIDGCFAAGSLTAIVGPNGAGKSTLLKTMVGVLRPFSGTVSGRSITTGAVAYLPQAAEIDRSFPISVWDTVILGAWRKSGALRATGTAAHSAANHALAAVGLSGFGKRQIGSLSVGQFQRVLFARLILQDAPTIILDEPFAALDARTSADLLGVIGRWHNEGRTVVAVLHDFDTVRAAFPQTLLLAREQIAWGATETVLTPAHLAKAKALVGQTGGIDLLDAAE